MRDVATEMYQHIGLYECPHCHQMVDLYQATPAVVEAKDTVAEAIVRKDEATRVCDFCHQEKALTAENFYPRRDTPGKFRITCRACWQAKYGKKETPPAPMPVAEVKPPIPTQECQGCKRTLPLTPEYWHRYAKNLDVNGGYNPTYCRRCRIERDRYFQQQRRLGHYSRRRPGPSLATPTPLALPKPQPVSAPTRIAAEVPPAGRRGILKILGF